MIARASKRTWTKARAQTCTVVGTPMIVGIRIPTYLLVMCTMSPPNGTDIRILLRLELEVPKEAIGTFSSRTITWRPTGITHRSRRRLPPKAELAYRFRAVL